MVHTNYLEFGIFFFEKATAPLRVPGILLQFKSTTLQEIYRDYRMQRN